MPGQRHEFCDLFHRSYARENQSPTSNQLGVFRFFCPYLSGLHTSLFWMSYRVACLELLDARCPNGSFCHKKKFNWRPTSGSACASPHIFNIWSGVILYCLHMGLGAERRAAAEQHYHMETGWCLGKSFRVFLHKGWSKPTYVVVAKPVFSRQEECTPLQNAVCETASTRKYSKC